MADCKYITDGTDTDGTVWHRCLTHDSVELSPDAHCAGNDDSPARVAPLWTWDNDYRRAWAPTTNPRVLAVIERQNDGGAIDGDMFAPAYVIGSAHAVPTGDTYRDAESDALAARYADAQTYLRDAAWRHRLAASSDELLARWFRIFYNASAETVSSSVQQGYSVVIFDTPGWREHTGAVEPSTWRVTSVAAPGQGVVETTHDVATEAEARAAHLRYAAEDILGERTITSAERASILAGDVETWKAYLDGDIFGIGYAILDDPEDVGSLEDGLTMTCWGFYGEEDAQTSALDDAVDDAADELKAREEAEAATARELAELAQREREAAADRVDLAVGLRGLNEALRHYRDTPDHVMASFLLANWPAAARFVAAVEAERDDTAEGAR